MINKTIHINAQLGYDPTHTITLRNKFARDMRKRFRILRGLIRKAIVDRDVFGLKNDPLTQQELPGRRSFDFPTSQEKVTAFMDWLQDQERSGVLWTARIPSAGTPINQAWTNLYIEDSYKRGVQRARYELNKAGYGVPPIEGTGGISASMSTPFHVDRVGVLYTRTFNGLKGITDAMDNQISQVLAQGLIDGDDPISLARKLTKTISGPLGDLGITDTLGRFIPAERRAEMLARTEIIRAHHQATIQEYQNWGIEGVTVKAEWATAGDSRVCPRCASMEGKVFTLDEIRLLIPLHPQCRCVALPVPVEEQPTTRKTTRKKSTTKKSTTKKSTTKKTTKKKSTIPPLQKTKNDLDDYVRKIGTDDEGNMTVDQIKSYRKLKYKYINELPENEYQQERIKLIDNMLKRGNANLDPRTISEMNRKGLDWVPYDVLDDLDKVGLRIEVSGSAGRAGYSPNMKRIRIYNGGKDYSSLAHEMAHAIDHAWSTSTISSRGVTGLGYQWKNNLYVTKKEGEQIQKWFQSRINAYNRQLGTYSNGDGQYYIDKWMDDYEARIYRNEGDGVEWWSMNIERYSNYKMNLLKYDEKVLEYEKTIRGVEGFQSRWAQMELADLQKIGREQWALNASQWGRAKTQYPELTAFIENKFSKKFLSI